MSTAYSSAKQKYIGNGVTTEWGFDFPIQKHSELKVYLKRSSLPQVLLEDGVDYSFVTENTITFPIKTGEAKLQAADVLALQRESVFESEYNFSNQQRLEPEEVMHADDNLERQIQELKRDSESAIKVQPTSNINTDEYFIAVESIYENLDNINNVSGISSDIITCSDNISDISTVSSNIANVNAVGQSISNVNTVAGNVSSVNTVSGSISDVTTVASIASSIPTVADNDANITTVATNISDVNTAATNIEAIKAAPAAATNAANSATSSANSAAASLVSAQQAATSAAGTHFKLFQHQWFDYELNNDMAWLRADTFSWQSGTVYTNAYNHLVDDINGITPATETVGGQTVTFYRAADGHKIVLADQETTVNNIYTATGVAWYYILDTVNNRFKLPRTKYDFNGLRGNVGDYIPESLPNITGSWDVATDASRVSGAFEFDSSTIASDNSFPNLINAGVLRFNASRSSSTYQNGAPVQQRGTQQYLYFYVGQYTQSAIEQTAGLNAELFNSKIDIDGNNVITAGANKILNTSSYTTNRILEIPQDIKLELNNGTLTLKAGSKVYVPNGFEADGTTPKFDVVTIESDLQTTRNIDLQEVYFIGPSSEFYQIPMQYCYSGNTTPSSFFGDLYAWWYDTTSNILKRTQDGGTTWVNNWSLPVCLSTSNTTQITSIDQVFNGFGYIGSTVFVLPGVQVQIPNGRNEDGTCKSVLYTQQNVSILTIAWGSSLKGKYPLFLRQDTNRLDGSAFNYYFVSSTTQLPSTDCLFYDSKTNLTGGTQSGSIYYFTNIYVGTMILEAGVLKGVNVETVDSVVNSNASNFSQAGRSYLSGLGMPSNRYIDLTLGASGSTYTAPANGWFVFGKRCSAVGQFLNVTYVSPLSSPFWSDDGGAGVGNICGHLVPVTKGQIVQVSYNAGGDTIVCRFIYAEGDQ